MTDKERLPDFLVIGAEKAGTTWLHTQLRTHDQIFMPETKEIHFFNKWDSRLQLRNNYKECGIDWYTAFFEQAQEGQRAGEVTPLYLCDAKAPERVAHTLPRARFICILRDPASRAYSHYWMAHRRGHEPRSFEEVVAARDPIILERGLYGAQLTRWQKCVDEDAMLVLIYEDVFEDPSAALAQIAEFLGVEVSGFETVGDDAVHKARSFRMPWLQNKAIRFARYLRESPGLAPLARLLKRSGLYGAFRKMNEAEEDYPALSGQLRQTLDSYYAADRAVLSELTGIDLGVWGNDGASSNIEADQAGGQ